MPGRSVAAGCGGIDAGLLKGNSIRRRTIDGLATDVRNRQRARPRRRHQGVARTPIVVDLPDRLAPADRRSLPVGLE